MRIVVTSTSGSDVATVHFRCSIGEGVGRWKGPNPPIAGETYDVELDVGAALEPGVNVVIVAPTSMALRKLKDAQMLIGLAEQIDPDGMLCLRLAPDALVMIESRPGQFSPGEMLQITVAAESISLTPFSL
jgi:hypothetical protein